MKQESAYWILGELGIDLTKRSISGAWHNFVCPFAPWYHDSGVDRNPSFGVSVSEDGTSKSFYRCLSCGQKGQLSLLPAKLGRLRGQGVEDFQPLVREAERLEYDETPIAREAPGWEDEGTEAETTEKKKAPKLRYSSALMHPYLLTRGLTWRDAWRLGLRFDEYQQRILFPVYNNRLLLEGFNGRSVMPKRLLTKKNPKSRDYGGLDKRRLFMFLPEFYRNPGKHKLILNEGAIDYARGQQAGFRGAHGTMGTALTEEKVTHLIEYGRPVFIFFDNDKAGQDAVYGRFNVTTSTREDRHNAWAHRLFQHIPVWICQYHPKAIEEERTDPGSLTVSEYRWGVKNAKLFVGADPEAGDENSIPF